jgi:hypothetical protein
VEGAVGLLLAKPALMSAAFGVDDVLAVPDEPLPDGELLPVTNGAGRPLLVLLLLLSDGLSFVTAAAVPFAFSAAAFRSAAIFAIESAATALELPVFGLPRTTKLELAPVGLAAPTDDDDVEPRSSDAMQCDPIDRSNDSESKKKMVSRNREKCIVFCCLPESTPADAAARASSFSLCFSRSRSISLTAALEDEVAR